MRIAVVLISFLILLSCKEEASHTTTAKPHTPARSLMLSKDLNMPMNYDSYGNVSFITQGPRGGVLIDANGKQISYRVFRIQISNDTTCTVSIDLKLPINQIKLSPDTTKSFSAFFFPELVSPTKVIDSLNFGIENSDVYFKTPAYRVSELKMNIKPKENRLVYVGTVYNGLQDLTRLLLFVKGHDPKVPFLPSVAKNEITEHPSIVFGIGIDPPNNYAFVNCGQMVFKKQD